jgi:hypothetical protein
MHVNVVRRVAGLLMVCAWAATAAVSAEPVQVTGGSLTMTGTSGQLAITGDRGFSYTATVFTLNGYWAPWSLNGCYFLCAAGPVSIDATWSGHDFAGTATLDGRTYENVGSFSGITSMWARFSGTVDVPAPGLESRVLVTPFTFTGMFHHGLTEQLVGSGWATVMLTPTTWEGQPLWALRHVRYDFSPDPIPEPATLLLVGGAAAGLALRRWRRQRGSATA